MTDYGLLLQKAQALAKEQFAGITDKSGVDYFSGFPEISVSGLCFSVKYSEL